MAQALLIAGTGSGQGKTSYTCALARRLRSLGERVRAFKVGPDFIDPGFLQAATAAPVHNLDLWMVGEERCASLLDDAAQEADWLLIEGAMGLYDGSPSAADLAARFAIPVLAVLDADAMAETFGALVLGLEAYGRARLLRWAGAAGNRVAGNAHARMLRDSLPPEIPWLGHLQRCEPALPERHLGLVQAEELRSRLDDTWHALDAALHLELPALRAVPAWRNPLMPTPASAPAGRPATSQSLQSLQPLHGRRIAVARDAAFSFCYRDNLDVLAQLGAEVLAFSPLADDDIPPEADAVYLPGGYPELHARRLARNERFLRSLRACHGAGRSVLAECGGMMICARALRDAQGREHPMAGLLDATAVMSERLTGIGLHSWRLPQGELRGHVFHYGRLEVRPPLAPAELTQPRRYGGPEAIYRVGSLTASFFHAYFASQPEAAAGLFSG